MTQTSHGAIQTVLMSNAIAGSNKLLDVGGGDGSIAIALANTYPNLKATIFNLPASAALARDNVAVSGLGDRVFVQEGNFLTDELVCKTDGIANEEVCLYDCIMFSRVLTDWDQSVCTLCFEKARRALAPGGKLVINEAFLEGNEDMFISWEFRYIFYDSFGRGLFKSIETYRTLLANAGFDIVKISPMLDDAFYSVVEAVAI
jgi:cyclopropane fatty-acyl-phospholipid synthase-like methyltransferase